MTKDQAQADFNAFCADLPYQRLSRIVQVVHQDGSIMVFHHATLWESGPNLIALPDRDQAGWIGVVTEHCGQHFFAVGDLMTWFERA